MRFKRRSFDGPSISMTPLINVIFLLLIFFMVAGTVENIEVLEVDLPKVKKGGGDFTNSMVIYLSQDGRIGVGDDLVSEEDFPTIVTTLFLYDENVELKIKPDLAADAARLVWLIGVIQKAGGKNISLVTEVSS